MRLLKVVPKLVSPEVAAASSAAAAAAQQKASSAPQAQPQDQEIKANRALQFKKVLGHSLPYTYSILPVCNSLL